MATSKRERQRANREKAAEEAAVVEEKVEQKRSFKRFGILALVAIALLAIVYFATRGGDETEAVTLTSDAAAAESRFAAWSAGAGDLDPAARVDIYDEPPPRLIDTEATYTAVVTLANGDTLSFTLLDDAMPNTVNNFVNLANDGYYDGLSFHAVGAGQALAGGPNGANPDGPGYFLNEEANATAPAVATGQLRVARNSIGNIHGSQFMVTRNATTFANQQDFTVFGELTGSADPLSALTEGDLITSISIETDNSESDS